MQRVEPLASVISDKVVTSKPTLQRFNWASLLEFSYLCCNIFMIETSCSLCFAGTHCCERRSSADMLYQNDFIDPIHVGGGVFLVSYL